MTFCLVVIFCRTRRGTLFLRSVVLVVRRRLRRVATDGGRRGVLERFCAGDGLVTGGVFWCIEPRLVLLLRPLFFLSTDLFLVFFGNEVVDDGVVRRDDGVVLTRPFVPFLDFVSSSFFLFFSRNQMANSSSRVRGDDVSMMMNEFVEDLSFFLSNEFKNDNEHVFVSWMTC